MKTKTRGKRIMDGNGDDDFAGVLMPCDTVVSNTVKAEITSSEPLMALDGEESALVFNGEEKDILPTSLKICAEKTQCTDKVENANEGKEVPKETPIICAEEKECTNDGGNNEDNATEGEEVGAKDWNVCVEDKDSINGGPMLDNALDVCAKEKECDSGAVDNEKSNIDIAANKKNTPAEIAKKTEEVGDQEDALEMTGDGEEGTAHGNTLGKIAEVKQVKANRKKIVNKLKRKRKVIKAKKASLIGGRVISKSTNKSLKNKTDAAADGETANEMNDPGVDNGENVDGRMSNEEEKKLTNIDTGNAKKGGDVVKADEEMTNDNEAEEMGNGKQVKATPKNNGKQLQKAKLRRKKKEVGLAAVDASVPRNMKEQASPPKKADKESKTMGMIFICSSKTKKDCYHYKLMGLPASKRDLVLSIHEGMKLFLFDVNLKLLYGVYRAAGPGGYNIEPKAFKSAYPSQVRFAVEEDCLPVPEEKFKTVIKDNYYQKNKFKAELTLGQVNSLCKLFQSASKSSNSNRLKKIVRQLPPKSVEKDRNRNVQRAGAQNSLADRDRNGKRCREVERPGPQATADRDRPNKRRREVERSGPQAIADRDRPNKRRWKDDRPRTHPSVNHDRPRQQQYSEHERYPAYVRDMAFRDVPAAYERRAYVSSVAPLDLHPQLPAPAVPSSYAYDLNVDLNVPRRPTLLERHDRSFIETDWRRQDIEYRRVLDDYEQGRLRDSESRSVGVEQLHYRERPSYYDRTYLTAQPAYYDTGRMQRDPVQPAYYDTGRMQRDPVQPAYYDTGRLHRDPAAPRLDYESLRSTYRY